SLCPAHPYGRPTDLHPFPTRRSSDLPTMSDQRARIAVDTDWGNLDWDAKTLKSRTDYPNEKITSVDATVLKKWTVPIDGLTRCGDRKSTRLNSSHTCSSYAVSCLKQN